MTILTNHYKWSPSNILIVRVYKDLLRSLKYFQECQCQQQFRRSSLLTRTCLPTTYLTFASMSVFSLRFPALNYSKKLPLSELPLPKDKYWSIVAYNQSKLCNLLFSMELNRRLKPKGVTCNAVHPGNLINTALSKNSWFYWLFFLMARPFAKSSVSQTHVWSVYRYDFFVYCHITKFLIMKRMWNILWMVGLFHDENEKFDWFPL